ncbi:MAG: hypothetical protein PHQ52_00055 [Candidatus Omnitrophica bacterium]|nr:hypothetical protein [Candidatus Omnitrophota bacterium]
MIYKYLNNPSGNSATIILVVLLLFSLSFNIFLFSSANTQLSSSKTQQTSMSPLLEKKITEMSSQNSELSSQFTALTEKTNELEKQLAQTQQLLEQAKQDIAAKQQIINEKDKTLSSTDEQQPVAQVQIQKIPDQKLEEYAKQVKELANTQISYYDVFKDHSHYVETLKKQIADLQEKISSLNNEQNTLKEQLLSKEQAVSSQGTVIQKELDKQKIDFLYQLALLSIENMLFEKAIDYFTQISVLSPKDANAYYNLAIINDQVLENTSSALAYYKKYIELSSNAEDVDYVQKRITELSQG